MMSKKMKRRSLRRDVGGFVGAGVGLGVGTAIVSGTGHGAAITPAFSAVGGMMRPVGTAMMAGHALRNLKTLQPKRKSKKKTLGLY